MINGTQYITSIKIKRLWNNDRMIIKEIFFVLTTSCRWVAMPVKHDSKSTAIYDDSKNYNR